MNVSIGQIVDSLKVIAKILNLKCSQGGWDVSSAAAFTYEESVWDLFVHTCGFVHVRVCVYSVHNALMVFDQEQIAYRLQHINSK